MLRPKPARSEIVRDSPGGDTGFSADEWHTLLEHARDELRSNSTDDRGWLLERVGALGIGSPRIERIALGFE